MKKKILKKSLNLISIQEDVLDEKEMDDLFGGRNCSLTCNDNGKNGHYLLGKEQFMNTWSTW